MKLNQKVRVIRADSFFYLRVGFITDIWENGMLQITFTSSGVNERAFFFDNALQEING